MSLGWAPGTLQWSSGTGSRTPPYTGDISRFYTDFCYAPWANRRWDRLGWRGSHRPPPRPRRRYQSRSTAFPAGTGSRRSHSGLAEEPDLSIPSNTASRIHKACCCQLCRLCTEHSDHWDHFSPRETCSEDTVKRSHTENDDVRMINTVN